MTDYLETLLPSEEGRDEGVLEWPGVRVLMGAQQREEQLSDAGGSALDGQSGVERSAFAVDGLAGESLENRGQELARDMDRVRAALERSAGENAADSRGERAAEEDAAGTVSRRLGQEGAGPAPSLFSDGGWETMAQAAALSAAVGRLRRAVQRQAAEPVDGPAVSRYVGPVQAYQPGEDPVTQVDAAFQRDARRYDGALGLL